jgi:dTMP kinase
MFISIDGPSGAGKSTIVRHLAQMLVAAGENVHITAEPSHGPVGVLCRKLTESVTGHALACLYAADRYHHVQTEIRPHVERGENVIATGTYHPAWSCSASTA